MHIPKRYGQSKINRCPFCEKQSTTENIQGIPTCSVHKKEELLDFKCVCGEWLDIKKGKYGAFFLCMNCGPISLSKALEINPIKPRQEPKQTEKNESSSKKKPADKEKREITIRSDEMWF